MIDKSNIVGPGARVLCLLFILAMSAATPASASPHKAYEVGYGILGKTADGKFYVKKQTTRIPFIRKSDDKEFMFGYIVKKDEEGFLLHTRITMPDPKSLYVNRPYSKEKAGGTIVITTQDRFYKSEQHELVMTLDDGDLPGVYKMEIFINDTLYRTIEFVVGGP